MSETYLITAKTVEEAIAIANREYADAEHEVSYEIIDMPKKGFFGIGAKDAKIKITVTKSQSVELGSLVADIRNMKSITNRGGESERREKKPQQQKKQPQQNSGAKNQRQSAKGDVKAESKAEQRTESRTESRTAQSSQQKPKSARPKAEQKLEDKPKTEPKQNPQPKKVEKAEKAEKIEKSDRVEKVDAKEAPVSAAQPSEEKKTEKYTSSLGNQVKQKSRRGDTVRKTPPQNEIPSSGVTVSAPVGLSDFVGGEKSGFGSDNYESGKMSNDVKKKPRITDPAKANMEALKALTAPSPDSVPAKSAEAKPETKKNNQNNQKDAPRDTSRDGEKRRSKKSTQPQRREKAAPEAKQEVRAEAKAEVRQVAEKKLREAVTQEEMDCALEFANTLLENMKLNAKAVPAEPDGSEEFIINGEANVYPKINITGEDTGILIGHHGETLDSIQYLVNLSALRKSKQKDGDYVKIVVDIEGYREKREETLRTLARRMAAKAVKYKRNIFLEPMNAYERRIIHSELQSFENVSTHSVGTDRDRKIIITYEGPDKRERPDRRYEARSTDKQAETGAEKTSENSGKRRKPNKLPIDKLTDFLESREEQSEDSMAVGSMEDSSLVDNSMADISSADEATTEEYEAAIAEEAPVELPAEDEYPEEEPDERDSSDESEAEAVESGEDDDADDE